MPVSGGGYNSRFVERWFGGPVNVGAFQASSGNNAAAVILSSSPDRLSMTIINLDSASVFIAPDQAGPASAINGILLQPNGGNVSLQVDADGPLVENGWSAFCASKAATLFILTTSGGP